MSPRGKQALMVDFRRSDSVRDFLMEQMKEGDDDYSMDPADLNELRKLPGNCHCIDCGLPNPDWASLNLGVFMCLECSGTHRSLGTHVSFIRSVSMDSWSKEQLKKMKVGGNKQCVRFLKKYGIGGRNTIAERYDSAPAMLYQQVLKARIQGLPEPTELSDYNPNSSSRCSKEELKSRTSLSITRTSIFAAAAAPPIQEEEAGVEATEASQVGNADEKENKQEEEQAKEADSKTHVVKTEKSQQESIAEEAETESESESPSEGPTQDNSRPAPPAPPSSIQSPTLAERKSVIVTKAKDMLWKIRTDWTSKSS